MAGGSFDAPLNVAGPDEIGDLARALDSMRASLKESFGVLTADRNKLAAIFDGLTDVGDRRRLRRPGALLQPRRHAACSTPPASRPSRCCRSCTAPREVGFSAHPALRIGDRAYAMTARSLPDERAVLAVLRDRTDELRRELAEADFISNAAHELRNPLAGISGAIEVLQSGAKNDPRDRDHFLSRLAEDAERMNRLTQSLLTLARVESRGAAESEVVDVAGRDPGRRRGGRRRRRTSSSSVEVEGELAATGDPTLLRQVMIGLLTNAFKNTPPPGTRYRSRPSRRRGGGHLGGRSTPEPEFPRRRSSACSSASTVAASRASRRASASAWRSPGAWST